MREFKMQADNYMEMLSANALRQCSLSTYYPTSPFISNQRNDHRFYFSCTYERYERISSKYEPVDAALLSRIAVDSMQTEQILVGTEFS